MGCFEEATFRGITGAPYRFEVHDRSAGFRDVGAVYVFARRMSKPAGGFVLAPHFIGQTPRLGETILAHERWPGVDRTGRTTICVMAAEDEVRRREIEADFLAAHVPPCNER